MYRHKVALNLQLIVRKLTPKLLLALPPWNCDSPCHRSPIRGAMAKTKNPGKSSRMRRDRRRKHRHWQVTIYYKDGEKFARVYIDRERATRFAERQRRSPVVKSTRIMEVD
jgi:hypothetical protein